MTDNQTENKVVKRTTYCGYEITLRVDGFYHARFHLGVDRKFKTLGECESALDFEECWMKD